MNWIERGPEPFLIHPNSFGEPPIPDDHQSLDLRLAHPITLTDRRPEVETVPMGRNPRGFHCEKPAF